MRQSSTLFYDSSGEIPRWKRRRIEELQGTYLLVIFNLNKEIYCGAGLTYPSLPSREIIKGVINETWGNIDVRQISGGVMLDPVHCATVAIQNSFNYRCSNERRHIQ